MSRLRWPNRYQIFIFLAIVYMAKSTTMRCDDARSRCAYRTGCGTALQHYMTGCAAVLQGENCSENCQHALIALTSTDEGKDLMTCQCAPEDDLCLESKQKVEICRSSVTRTMSRTRVSCRVASFICNADAICQMALVYYNKYCKSMFHGRKCTHRCRNSIDILRRQEKAARLNTCLCDGSEDYDCKAIHRNMDFLCFGKVHHDYRETKKVLNNGLSGDVLRTVADGDSQSDNDSAVGTESAAAARATIPLDKTILTLIAAILVLSTKRD